jgi:imidazolonepropionase-like amidohydrolase
MRAGAALVVLAALVIGGGARADLAITNVTVIDGTGGPALAGATVVVRGDRIAAVGKARPPAGVPRIDGRGKFLIPGLIDTHIHLFGGGAWRTLGRTVQEPIDWDAGLSALHGYLYLGVTSVYDAGNNPEFIYPLRARERAGEIVSPRIFATGKLLSYPGSWSVGYAGIGTPDWPQAIAVLDGKIAEQPDLQKITVERRGVGPDPLVPAMPVALLREIVAYLKARGVRTTVHISTEDLAQAAVDAGIDTLAHPVGTARQTEAFTREVGARRMPVSTTLAVFEDIIRLGEDSGYLDDPIFRAVLPPDEVAARREKGAPRYVSLGWPGWFKTVLPFAQENLRRLHQAGAVLALGSDRSDGPFAHRELELIVAAGLTPAEAIRIGTLNGAIYLGRERDLGSIAPGKLADLVLLDADPTVQIANARRINTVIKGGQVIDRGALALPVNKPAR